MASKQLQFLDELMPSVLQPGETVLARGVAENPAKWALSVFTFGLLFFLRVFYYVIVTDRRVVLLSAKGRTYWRIGLPMGYRSAGLRVDAQHFISYDQVSGVTVNRQSPIHMLLGWRGLHIGEKNGKGMSLFIRRSAPQLKDEQGKLYRELPTLVAQRVGMQATPVGR
jgi:hypothetical protein